jgi:HTH-type transcriptional repressor of NAD biosynthesis genes
MEERTAKFGRAVVIGKFYPPHRGHKLVIDMALEQSRSVAVIVCAKPTDTISGALRRRWLQEIHPAADIMLIDDRYDENDTSVWAANTIALLGVAPDAVFTSEDYGEAYARAMGCAHVLADRHRVNVPCSGTAIRHDPFTHWQCLDPPVRAWFALRVCVLGAESTGTTTLAQALAEHYETMWVPEYGREYSETKWARDDHRWSNDEFVHIAAEQNTREERAARMANRVLICDTNKFATMLWHRRYVGDNDERVRLATSNPRCDLYLLTGDEIPFVQDGLRDGEHLRHEMHGWFEVALRQQPVPWLLLRGSPEERAAQATKAIDFLLRRP